MRAAQRVAVCESTFSTLTRINRPQRLSMNHSRMANLTLFAFEAKRTKNLDLEAVLRKRNAFKDIRLRLGILNASKERVHYVSNSFMYFVVFNS